MNMTLLEKAAMRATLNELKTAHELLGEVIAKAADLFAELERPTIILDGKTGAPIVESHFQIVPSHGRQLTSEETKEVNKILEEQPIKSKAFSPKPNAVGNKRTFKIEGPMRGKAVTDEFKAITQEIAEYLKDHPNISFNPIDLAEASPTAVRRYPNEHSRTACLGKILKNYGYNYGVKNVSKTVNSKWAYLTK